MTLMLLPGDKYLFFGADRNTVGHLSEISKYMNEFLSRPIDPVAFASFGITMVIDARVTPAIGISIKE